MDVVVSVLICYFSALFEVSSAAPPDICFQQFKWEDCGMSPKAVIYYYKSGSRCEVGLWRGCQPNPNMFADEYECVQTCIFSVRAKPQDYHHFQENVIQSGESTAADIPITTTGSIDVTTTDATAGYDVTIDATEGGNEAEGHPDDTNPVNDTKNQDNNKNANS